LTPPTLFLTSGNGINGTWSPATINNTTTATYTFTPDPGQCVTGGTTLIYEVNPVPSTNIRSDTSVFDGATVPAFNITGTPGTPTIRWTNSNPAIGLPASGTGNVPSFTAINLTNAPVTATITVIANINGCFGASKQYVITVLPLDKDLFVPNVFSPNGDGKNDILYVYGNYITSVDMRIFNQWGQQIAVITNKAQGWNGTHKGNPQPVGVYVYVLKAEMRDGRKVNLKGSITLVR
jgi:gliding motility-associated-like protein